MMIGGLFGLIILVLDIYAMLQVLGSSTDTVKKVLWILGIWLLPVLGLLVWYVAGPKKNGVPAL